MFCKQNLSTYNNEQKMKFPLKISLQFPVDLVTFTQEILNWKLHFLCSVNISWSRVAIVRTCSSLATSFHWFQMKTFLPLITEYKWLLALKQTLYCTLKVELLDPAKHLWRSFFAKTLFIFAKSSNTDLWHYLNHLSANHIK